MGLLDWLLGKSEPEVEHADPVKAQAKIDEIVNKAAKVEATKAPKKPKVSRTEVRKKAKTKRVS